MLTTGLLLISALAVGRTDSVSVADIQREYDALVRIASTIGPNGRDSVQLVYIATDSLPSQSLLASLLKSQGQIVWYLASHTPGAETRIIEKGENPAVIRDSVIGALRSSAVFNDRLLAMLARYWQPRGRTIANYSTPFAPVSISKARLNQIAARFFYPDRVSSVGDTVFTHICAGVNGLRDLPDPVDPLIEAFVFVAVRGEVFRPHSPLMSRFETAMRRAKVTSASKSVETRLQRAQGALWSQLESSPALATTLAAAYARDAKLLPLRVTAM